MQCYVWHSWRRFGGNNEFLLQVQVMSAGKQLNGPVLNLSTPRVPHDFEHHSAGIHFQQESFQPLHLAGGSIQHGFGQSCLSSCVVESILGLESG